MHNKITSGTPIMRSFFLVHLCIVKSYSYGKQSSSYGDFDDAEGSGGYASYWSQGATGTAYDQYEGGDDDDDDEYEYEDDEDDDEDDDDENGSEDEEADGKDASDSDHSQTLVSRPKLGTAS